jgi:hypothetical protein
MDRGVDVGDRIEQVQGADDIVHLCVDGVLAVDHRVRRGSLLGEVDNRLGRELTDGLLDEHVVGQVAYERLHGVTGDFLPRRDPPLQLPDGHETVDAHLGVVQASSEVVHDTDIVVSRGKVQCGRPAKVTVATEYEDPHRSLLLLVDRGSLRCPVGVVALGLLAFDRGRLQTQRPKPDCRICRDAAP